MSRGPGLIFCATQTGDFVYGTLQLAAGMNLHVFTTGRGTIGIDCGRSRLTNIEMPEP